MCLLDVCFMDLKACGSFEMGLNIPGVASDEGRGFVLAMCLPDDGGPNISWQFFLQQREGLFFNVG